MHIILKKKLTKLTQ